MAKAIDPNVYLVVFALDGASPWCVGVGCVEAGLVGFVICQPLVQVYRHETMSISVTHSKRRIEWGLDFSVRRRRRIITSDRTREIHGCFGVGGTGCRRHLFVCRMLPSYIYRNWGRGVCPYTTTVDGEAACAVVGRGYLRLYVSI